MSGADSTQNGTLSTAKVTRRHFYTVPQLLEALDLSRPHFYTLLKQGQLPFLEELKPRIGARRRYRADLVDRYLAGQWGQPRSFRRVS